MLRYKKLTSCLLANPAREEAESAIRKNPANAPEAESAKAALRKGKSRKSRKRSRSRKRKSRKRSRSRKRKSKSKKSKKSRKSRKSRKSKKQLTLINPNKKSTPARVFYTDFQGPYLKVVIQRDRVDMYTMTYNDEKYEKYEKECEDKYRDAWCREHQYDFKKFKSFRSQNVLVGTDPSFGPSVDGYSLLFQTGKHTYVYAGNESYAFTVANGDRIVQLFNKIGNSHVPYPVAVGEKYVYFMLDMTYVDKQLFPPNANYLDAYGEYYYSFRDGKGGWTNGLDQQAQKMKGLKRLAYKRKRQWHFS
jgi:hypothetical protein